MIRFKTLLFFIIILQCLAQQRAYCQSHANTFDDPQRMAAALDVYYKSLGVQAGLYNGVEYSGYAHIIKDGHQYFESDNFTPGNIFYDGMLYNNVPLWYDLIRDQVIVRYADSVSKIVLHNEKIDRFSIYNHNFIHLIRDTLVSSSPSSGFYDKLYSGKSEVLVKRTKSFLENMSKDAGIWIVVLKQKNDRYLKKDGIYYNLSNAASVLKALGSRQKEVQQYMKKNKIKFRSDPEKAIVMMVSYFEQING